MDQYKNKLLQLMLFGYGGCMLLLVGLSTGVRLLNSNIVFQDGLWVISLDILIALVDVFAFAIAAAVVIYGIYLFGPRSLTTIYAAFLSMTVFHYVAILCIGWMIFPGTLPDNVGALLLTIAESLFLFVLIDCLRLFLVAFATQKTLAKRESERKAYNRRANILGDEARDARSVAFPLAKFVSLKNPLQFGAFIMAIVYWSVFLIQYVYYAIMNIIKLSFFEYLGFQIMELGFYAILAFICYCITDYTLIKLDEKMPKIE